MSDVQLLDTVEHPDRVEELALRTLDLEALNGALSVLTSDQRRVVEIRLAGLTGPEIREVLGRSRSWVDTTQFRAVQRFQKFDGDGVYLATIGEPGIGSGQLSQPSSIAIDSDGNLVVADFGNRRLQIFRPDGSVIGSITGIPGYSDTLAPNFVKFDQEGNLYISDEAGNSVIKVTLPPLA